MSYVATAQVARQAGRLSPAYPARVPVRPVLGYRTTSSSVVSGILEAILLIATLSGTSLVLCTIAAAAL